jgi:hypothetical protein
MFDSCEIRVHPTGKALARIGVQRRRDRDTNDLCPDHRC